MKLTALDSKEIPRYTYDEDKQANRVVLVDVGLADAIKENLKNLKIEIPAPIIHDTHKVPEQIRTEFQKIEVPVIIKETDIKVIEVEKPVIQTEVKIIEIQKPIIQKELEIQRVEVPVIVKEKEIVTVYVDKLNYKLLFIMQVLVFGLIVLSKFIK